MGSSMASLLVHGTRWCIVHCHGSFVIWYYIMLIREKNRKTDSSYKSYNKKRNTESSFEINFFILTIPSLSFYRCCCDDANTIPLIKIRNISLFFNYISVRR